MKGGEGEKEKERDEASGSKRFRVRGMGSEEKMRVKKEEGHSRFGIQAMIQSPEGKSEKKESPGSSESQKGGADAKLGALVSFLDEMEGEQQQLGMGA